MSIKKSTLEMLGSFSILVVEDDDVARVMIKQGLKEYFGSYYDAKDGMEGLNIFKKYRVDIIVADIHMPKLNGFEMIKEIFTIKPQQPFIIITSYDTDQNILNSVHNGAFSFLRKPLNIQDLQTAILLSLSKKINQKRIRLSPSITIDANKEIIYRDDKPIFLTQTNNKIFWLLCYNLNHVVSYSMIEDYIYYGESVNKSTIHTAILRIKKQLADVNIENVSNTGYIIKNVNLSHSS
ncbi:MAG: response regulator transcription factor [Campylobacteraceae bacterium]|jgi:DNA-binding response OmpR family regulator|nr:response regulator transcription factor [Campylobacteraceae bacterium]